MQFDTSTDYATYKGIMEELLQPIVANGLDHDTLKRLYESKLVYLENLRIKCFHDINSNKVIAYFSTDDYAIILKALEQTKAHVRDLIILAVKHALATRQT